MTRILLNTDLTQAHIDISNLINIWVEFRLHPFLLVNLLTLLNLNNCTKARQSSLNMLINGSGLLFQLLDWVRIHIFNKINIWFEFRFSLYMLQSAQPKPNPLYNLVENAKNHKLKGLT